MREKLKWRILDQIEKVVLGYGKYRSGQLAMEKMVHDYNFDTILDLGCGDGYASEFFTQHGKQVTANDYGKFINFKDTMAKEVIIGDFNKIDFGKQFEAIWCAHCLEHQLNVQLFLERICGLLCEGGTGSHRPSNEEYDCWGTCLHMECRTYPLQINTCGV